MGLEGVITKFECYLRDSRKAPRQTVGLDLFIGESKYHLGNNRKNPDKPWNWVWLSYNPNITWEIVCSNPDKSWDLDWLLWNLKITWDIIEKYPHVRWNWNLLSKRSHKIKNS